MPNPNSSIFPGGLPTDLDLTVATNSFTTTLANDITDIQVNFDVASAAFNTPALVRIDNEIIRVHSVSGVTLQNCDRGFDGTSMAPHSATAPVKLHVIAWHHNQIAVEVESICVQLGIGLANVITTGEVAGGDLAGTYPNPSVKSVSELYTNDTGTGTTVNRFAKFTGAPSTAVVSGTADVSGTIGVVTSGAGNSGSCRISQRGQVSVDFDGATTAGDYVQLSTTTAGKAHAAGSTYPLSKQILGRVLSTNVGAGTYIMELFGPDIKPKSQITIPIYIDYKSGVSQAGNVSIGFSTPVSNPAVGVDSADSNNIVGLARFGTGQVDQLQDHFYLSPDQSGAIDIEVIWRSSATAGNVQWNVATSFASNSGAIIDNSFNAAQSVTTTVQSSTLNTNSSKITGLTTTGIVPGGLMFWQLTRSNGGVDTMAAPADVIEIIFTVRRTIQI